MFPVYFSEKYELLIAGYMYRHTYNIRCTLVGIKSVYHSYVVGASPVGTAPTTS